jgi:hypothetical protein
MWMRPNCTLHQAKARSAIKRYLALWTGKSPGFSKTVAQVSIQSLFCYTHVKKDLPLFCI